MLTQSVEKNTPISAASFTDVPVADQQGVVDALVNQEILVHYDGMGHYVKYDYFKNNSGTLTTSQLMKILKEVGYVSNDDANVIHAHAIDLTATIPTQLSAKLDVQQVRDLQQLLVNKKTVQTLHLSQSASAVNEQGAGFQIANVDVINAARKISC